MEKEILENDNVVENDEGENKYIEAIADLKKNSVSKEDYEKLENENAKLLKALIDGEQIVAETGKAENVDVDKRIEGLRKELYVDDSDLSDLEIASKTLELRKLIIDRDGEENDPFLPTGITPTSYDIEKAQLVAQELQDAVDKAEGSDEVFRGHFVSKIKDDPKSKVVRK